MALRTRIQIAKADILRHFDELSVRVLKRAQISKILTEQRGFWRLAQRTNSSEFIHFLMESGRLKEYNFRFPAHTTQAYVWGEVPMVEIALTLRPRSFLSHYTAVRAHGLTEQLPKTLYVTHEPADSYAGGAATVNDGTLLTQEDIDTSFQKPERFTKEIAELDDQRICLISGMYTRMLGVTEAPFTAADSGAPATVRVTSLERTLIDITVRPGYAGGIAEVLKAYIEAQPKVSANKLRATLQKFGYVYPYHQAIGFYMERAGYGTKAIELFQQMPRPRRFHLAHAIEDKEYVEQWNLYIPKGF